MRELPPLWEHQKRAIERGREESLALFFEVGTGKTRATCEIIQNHFARGAGRCLIFAPPVVLENWRREFLKFTDIPDTDLFVLYGAGKKREEELKRLQGQTRYIVITNYESVLMPKLFAEMAASPFDILVCDESQRVKSASAKRTKRVLALSQNIPFKYLLSGTPVLNSPMDLFSQYQIMLGGFPYYHYEFQKKTEEKRLINNFYFFRNKFFYDKNAGMPKHVHFPQWVLKPTSVEEINRTVNETSIHVKKKDCLDLPPFIRTRRDVEMTPEQQKCYDEMMQDFITFIDDKACVASLALTKALRLMQIVSGFMTLEDGRIHGFHKNKRQEALYDLLEELTPEHKVIVWSVWKENYQAIRNVCNDLKLRYAELHGGITQPDKVKEIDRFNNDPEFRVLIANQSAGGVGVNLIASDTSIYYSRDYRLESDVQSEARNYRAGSEIHPTVTRIDLVTPNSIDEIVLKRLEGKMAMGEELLKVIRESHGTKN